MSKESIVDQLRAATKLLEELARNRDLMRDLTPHERARLTNAAGDVFCPDLDQRRGHGPTSSPP